MLNMKVDNPEAFRFIMQEEIYLLDKDKAAFTTPDAEAVTNAADPVTAPPQPEVTVPYKEQTTGMTEAIKPVPAMPLPAIQTPANEFNYLGKNNKNFLVLVNYADEEHIATGHLTALDSMLKRKGLQIDDVAILNVNKYLPVKLTQLAAYFAPGRLVIMGKDALPEGIGNLPLNQPLQGKKTHVLYSFSFDEMMSSNDNKKIFWEHMKTL